MSFNVLSSLNLDSFRGLGSLEELRLDGNSLTSFPWESLMDMPSLRLLDIHNNQLSSVPSEAALYMKNLTYLDLSSNNLLTVPPEVLNTWLTVKPVQGAESSKMILGKFFSSSYFLKFIYCRNFIYIYMFMIFKKNIML